MIIGLYQRMIKRKMKIIVNKSSMLAICVHQA